MDKLRTKLIIILFGLLSIFNTSIVGYGLVHNYNDTYEQIEEVLDIVCSSQNDEYVDEFLDELHKEGVRDTGITILYVGYEVYTVTMEDGEAASIYYHHAGSEKHIDIKKVVDKISTEDKKEYIGNLFRSAYAYRRYNNNGNLVVVCTKSISQELIRNTWNQVLLALAVEFVAYSLSYILVKWLIEPVRESFAKQKQFVADASHELKTPLAVIMTSCEALISEPGEPKWLYNIENESERMNSLIVDMLDLAQLDGTQRDIETQEINLSKLIEKTILVNEALLFEKNVSLEEDIEESVIVNVNESQFKEVLDVLMDNASKYADHMILVSLKKNKKYVTLKVCNDGQMINEDEATKIFERFYKSDRSRNREDNHYGLGLAIAKSIIEAHHGTIKAYSVDGITTLEINIKVQK